VSAALVSGGVALICLLLGRWGLRSAGDLVPVTASPERRALEERRIRRGAKSCFVLGALFTLLAVVSAVEGMTDGGTTL
jgi:hypothetical protein